MIRLALCVVLFSLLAGGSHALAQDQPTSAPVEKNNSNPTKPASDEKAGPSASKEGQAPKKSAVDENPFPEDQSKSAAKDVEAGQPLKLPPDLAGEGSAAPPTDPEGKTSASRDTDPVDGDVSSSRTRLEGLDDIDPDASRKKNTTISQPMRNSKLSTEDVAIGKMYLQTDNYRGAYIRYKEALSLNPENADAAFGVAETARKLNQAEEARQNYQLCIDLDPDGPRAKAARKALAALSARSSH